MICTTTTINRGWTEASALPNRGTQFRSAQRVLSNNPRRGGCAPRPPRGADLAASLWREGRTIQTARHPQLIGVDRPPLHSPLGKPIPARPTNGGFVRRGNSFPAWPPPLGHPVRSCCDWCHAIQQRWLPSIANPATACQSNQPICPIRPRRPVPPSRAYGSW